MDDGGCRRGGVMLEKTAPSPAGAYNSIGSGTFTEPLSRVSAQERAAHDRRKERQSRGLVRFHSEPRVPDVGGLGWRTGSGHLLKNQAYYCQRPKVNKWDEPVHAGVNTWKDWHGPKQRADADTMERLDRYDEDQDRWEAKRTFVSTSRVESLDRLYSRKLERVNFEHASSWAPHRRARREVHSSHETFDGGLDEKPEKELRKVLTAKVLERDREAVQMITARIDNEEMWKQVWTEMEQERRADIRANFRARQAHTDRLMAMSGQPVRESQPHRSANSCSQRSEELARPVRRAGPEDVTQLSDFAGLAVRLHGTGVELGEEFRPGAPRSVEPGWPPAAAEILEASDVSLARASIPVPSERFEHNMGSRNSPDVLARHSKVQLMPTTAPVPPDQTRSMLKEDWSPAATFGSTRLKASARDFSRTTTSMPLAGLTQQEAKESLPAPTRSMTYPVICETGPSSPASPSSPKSWQEAMPDSTLERLRRNESAPAPLGRSGRRRSRRGPISDGPSEKEAAVKSVCNELDNFEASLGAVSRPNLANFFGTPQGTGGGVRLKATLRRGPRSGA